MELGEFERIGLLLEQCLGFDFTAKGEYNNSATKMKHSQELDLDEIGIYGKATSTTKDLKCFVVSSLVNQPSGEEY